MDRPQEIARKVFFSLCISAFTITTKFGIQIMRELNVRHNNRKCFSKVAWLWKKHSGKSEMSVSITVWLTYILNKILWETEFRDFTVGRHFNPDLSPKL